MTKLVHLLKKENKELVAEGNKLQTKPSPVSKSYVLKLYDNGLNIYIVMSKSYFVENIFNRANLQIYFEYGGCYNYQIITVLNNYHHMCSSSCAQTSSKKVKDVLAV